MKMAPSDLRDKHQLKRKNEAEQNLKVKRHNNLVPLPVLPHAPARQDERLLFLKKLYQVYYKMKIKYPVHESVIKEYELAKQYRDKNSYTSGMRTMIFNLNKYGNPSGSKKTVHPATTDSSSSGYEEKRSWLEILNSLCISRSELVLNGYIMDIPDIDDETKRALPSFVNCDRCGEKFDLKTQMEPKEKRCRFHKGKVHLSNKLKDVIVKHNNQDYKTRYYSCCNQEIGYSQGCSFCAYHVYKYTDPIQMHLKLPFQTIQELRRKYEHVNEKKFMCRPFRAIGLDCEMCYTSCGFEMMKCSIVNLETMQMALDIIIKPKGEIIDLNTFVSGVDNIPDDAMDFDSFLDLLANMTDENTIVIGHGLENDLNVLRMIYPKIIDTAILYSESSTRKESLKSLASKILNKDIQMGSHDSLEDALIPLEIVKRKANIKL